MAAGIARLGSGPGMRITSRLPGATAASVREFVSRMARLAVHSANMGGGEVVGRFSGGEGKGVEEM